MVNENIQGKFPKGFNRALKKAEKLLKNNKKFRKVLVLSKLKSQANKRGLSEVWKDFNAFRRLLKAWVNKEYTQAPWKSIVFAAAAIVYFLNPIDVIPDFIPGLGFLDDVGIISYVLTKIKDDLDAFKVWEENNTQATTTS